MDKLRLKTCCFSGHRDVKEKDIPAILSRVEAITDSLEAKGVIYYGVGGALGFDTLMAEYIIKRRERDNRLKLIEILPYPDYRKYWTAQQQRRAEVIDSKADKIVYCSKFPSKAAYLARDRHMVDGSAYCVAYCEKPSGGTAYTVKYALEQGLTVLNVENYDINSLILQKIITK